MAATEASKVPMKTDSFYYELPDSLIAQHPAAERAHSRMMVINRSEGTVTCRHFYDILEYFGDDDTLVINDSRVIPARLTGTKETGASIEILLLTKLETPETWEVLLKPAKRVRPGTRIDFEGGPWAEVLDRVSEKKWTVSFQGVTDFPRFIERYGRTPLPPYIRRRKGDPLFEDDDRERYQTVYAQRPGSVAAPTAGLHFTEEILTALRNGGTGIVPVTLHVGYGTFLPITSERIEEHRMEREYFELSEEAARRISSARRLTAAGTTSTRVIETCANGSGGLRVSRGYTDLFIYPGYRFKRVDRLLTNFHLPRSSLFLLVCAFAGTELIRKAYAVAVEERFRFYSYGDCMLII